MFSGFVSILLAFGLATMASDLIFMFMFTVDNNVEETNKIKNYIIDNIHLCKILSIPEIMQNQSTRSSKLMAKYQYILQLSLVKYLNCPKLVQIMIDCVSV
jgi:hypothetical protein